LIRNIPPVPAVQTCTLHNKVSASSW